MSHETELESRYGTVMINAFGAPRGILARGEGVYLWDADGNRYVDLLAGIAVDALEHGHLVAVAVVTGQLKTLGHISNFFASEPQIRLAERLSAAAGGGRVFLANSGAETSEAAFKLSRLTGRTRLVAMEGSFHGQTMGALTVTHIERYREPFEPLPRRVTLVPFGDAGALGAVVDETVAAVVIEPIQGESGVIPVPEGYLAVVRELTTRAGTLLWIDEVQTGIGRCGELLLSRSHGMTAGLATVAKGLGNGFPIGACIATGRAADLLTPGGHGSTFGGSPVAAAAGNAVLDVLDGGLLEDVRRVGEWFAFEIMGLGCPEITGVRGMSLLRGIVLTQEVAPQVTELALSEGWVLNAPRPDVLWITPPLIIMEADLAPFVTTLPGWLERRNA